MAVSTKLIDILSIIYMGQRNMQIYLERSGMGRDGEVRDRAENVVTLLITHP